MALVGAALPAWAQPVGDPQQKAPGSVRFATFNAALSDDAPGAVLERLRAGGDPQIRLVVETIQRAAPDVLVLQELDRDEAGEALTLIRAALRTGEGGADGIDYLHTLFPVSNTGVPSGVDLDGDGVAAGPRDAKGFGHHPGHYGFALLSRFPVDDVRTFGGLLWRDVPGALIPDGYYSADALAVLPLSSKTHLMARIATPAGPVTVIAAHPTPPVFDDPAIDWNGRRNADEIRLLVDLLDPHGGGYAVDDAGVAGGLAPGAAAVVMGDLNADPERGDSRPGAIARLLNAPGAVPVTPLGARKAATAEFGGGLRVDYVQPFGPLAVTGSGVFWPADGRPLARLAAASDHRLVWVDVTMAP